MKKLTELVMLLIVVASLLFLIWEGLNLTNETVQEIRHETK